MTLEGAMTALITPMRNGAVDFDAMSRLIEEQIAAGIDGIVAVGTTGESATLDVEEHIAVIRHAVRVADKRIPIIAGAGANATAEAIELSRASAEVGADALLHVAPYYNKPTQEGLYRHFAAIAAATPLPVVLYNVPSRTACDILPETVLRLAAIDNICAIKEATGDLRRATELVAQLPPTFTVLSGDDFTAFPVYAVGGRGVISVVSNVVPARMAAMWDAWIRGDLAAAQAQHHHIQPLTRLLFAEANPTGVKAALALMGKIDPEIRLPLAPATESLRERLRAQLRSEELL